MKTKYTLLLLSLFPFAISFAQSATARFQGTIKTGTAANSVILAIKPNETFTGAISNLQFVVQVPNTITPMPAVSIKNNPLSTYVPTASYLTEVSNEGGYYNYLFAVAPPSGSAAYSFTANTETDALELQFMNGPASVTSEVRLAQLANGGTSGQKNFYIEISGNDNTNTTAMFYGAGANDNTMGYTAYSYVPVAGITLPVTLLDFSVYKQSNTAMISWKVANDQDISYYELQRSTNGSDFTAIGSVSKTEGVGTKTYNYTDASLSNVNSGIVYYRIKQVEANGAMAYTDIRLLRLDAANNISVFPNPATKGFYVMMPFESTATRKVQLKLYTLTGQLVQQKEISTTQATNYYFHLETPVVPGTYLLKIEKDNKGIGSKRIVIEQ